MDSECIKKADRKKKSPAGPESLGEGPQTPRSKPLGGARGARIFSISVFGEISYASGHRGSHNSHGHCAHVAQLKVLQRSSRL